MITEEEKQEIIDKAVEKSLLLLPETVGAMMASAAAMNGIKKKFLSDNPEFEKHKDIVQSVVEMTEGKNPLMDYEKLLKTAVPDIKRRIATVGKLDMKKVSDKPSLTFDQLNAPSDQHGKI